LPLRGKFGKEDGRTARPFIEQHDNGFDLAVQQAAFFYKFHTDEGQFNNQMDFYNGELLPLADIPDESNEEDEEEEVYAEEEAVGEGTVRRDRVATPNIVNVCD